MSGGAQALVMVAPRERWTMWRPTSTMPTTPRGHSDKDSDGYSHSHCTCRNIWRMLTRWNGLWTIMTVRRRWGLTVWLRNKRFSGSLCEKGERKRCSRSLREKSERKRCSGFLCGIGEIKAGLETQVRRRVLKKIGRGEMISYLYLLLLCILIPMVLSCIYSCGVLPVVLCSSLLFYLKLFLYSLCSLVSV